jgi:hypothetical protein
MSDEPRSDLTARREKAAIDAHALYVGIQHVPPDHPARMILRAMHTGVVSVLAATYPAHVIEETRRVAASLARDRGQGTHRR